MKRIIRLTESDLTRIIRRVIMEGNLKVGEIVKVTDGFGTLEIEIDESTPNGYQGIIVDHSGDFGVSSKQVKMSNIAIGNLATIKMIDDSNVSVTLSDTYKKSVKAKIK